MRDIPDKDYKFVVVLEQICSEIFGLGIFIEQKWYWLCISALCGFCYYVLKHENTIAVGNYCDRIILL